MSKYVLLVEVVFFLNTIPYYFQDLLKIPPNSEWVEYWISQNVTCTSQYSYFP